jgi:PAS domain S-box-containing protein
MVVDALLFPLPANEPERLAALRRCRILYQVREEIFDRITEMARSMLGTARGLIAFVDEDQIWYKSGPNPVPLPRNGSFTAHTILSDEVLVIPDSALETRFSSDGGWPKTPARFYAGAPLITRDGFRIGALCVTDDKPHADLTEEQRDWLRILAQLAMNEIDLRRELAARNEAERDRELMSQLMLAIAEAPGARDAIDTSVRLIAIAVGAVHGAVFEVVPHRQTIQMVGAFGATPLWRKEIERVRHATIEVNNSLTGLALIENRPVVTDVRDALKQFPQLGEKVAHGSQTSITIPLTQGGRRFAFHFFFENRPDDAEALAERMVELAEKVRPALARKLSEERLAWLQSMMLNADDAAILMMPDNVTDPDSPLRIAYVNPAMTRITGYSAEELTGQLPATLCVNGEELAALEKIEHGAPLRREMQWRRKDGSLFWAGINAVSVDADGDGAGRRVVAMLRDMTLRRDLEQALREREQTFHLMFSSAPVPMMLLDVKNQRYVEVNDAAVNLFGYGREEFLAMSAETIRSPEELLRYKAIMRTPVPDSGRRGMWRYIRADGSEVMVDVAVHPFRFQGRAMAIIVTVDVTEQKRAEEQIRRARDAAEAVSRAKSDLLANMSHELRTPLNAIIGFSQIMREELFGPLGAPRYTGYVGDILESAHHLLAVINDILDLAKIEANSWQIKEKEINPQDVVSSTLRLVRPRADEAGIGLEFVHHAEGIALFADETALKRVLVNLLANAVKFSEAGTRVTVECRLKDDGGVAFVVTDHGIGMDPEDIPVALTPFQQVDIGLRRKYEGTGLGLPIAKQLMELHGGALEIQSARGIGTTVTISLPAERVIGADGNTVSQGSAAQANNNTADVIAAISAAPKTTKAPVAL